MWCQNVLADGLLGKELSCGGKHAFLVVCDGARWKQQIASPGRTEFVLLFITPMLPPSMVPDSCYKF